MLIAKRHLRTGLAEACSTRPCPGWALIWHTAELGMPPVRRYNCKLDEFKFNSGDTLENSRSAVHEYLFWSARKIAGAIADRELSSVEVTAAHLDRIAAVNPAINAVVQLSADTAMDAAKAADKALAEGLLTGPLHGLPITLKDSIDTAGVVTTGGSLARASFVPIEDATVAQRLRAAGAILLGKTNTPELTLSPETDNLVYGRTSNPYDLARTPGGSSGGAAAIIASGGSPLDIGSDTGGSVREPAHYCGITALNPGPGWVPRTGHIVPFAMGAFDALTRLGPMARYVEDLALAFPIIAGVDWRDPSMVPMPVRDPLTVDVNALRIGFYTDNGVTTVSADVDRAIRETAGLLSARRVAVTEVSPPLQRAAQAALALRTADGGAIARRLLHRSGIETPGPHLAYCLEGPPALSTRDYTAMLEEVDQVRSEMLGFMPRLRRPLVSDFHHHRPAPRPSPN